MRIEVVKIETSVKQFQEEIRAGQVFDTILRPDTGPGECWIKLGGYPFRLRPGEWEPVPDGDNEKEATGHQP